MACKVSQKAHKEYERLITSGSVGLNDILRVLNSLDEEVRLGVSGSESLSEKLSENVLRITINVSDDNGEPLSTDQTLEFDFVSSEDLVEDLIMSNASKEECFTLTIKDNTYTFLTTYFPEYPDSTFSKIVYEISEEDGYARLVSDSEQEMPFNGNAWSETYFLLSQWKRIVDARWLSVQNVQNVCAQNEQNNEQNNEEYE